MNDFLARFRERLDNRQQELDDDRNVLAALERARYAANLVTADRDRLFAVTGPEARYDAEALNWCRRHNCVIRCKGAANTENSTLTVTMPDGRCRTAAALAGAVDELRVLVE